MSRLVNSLVMASFLLSSFPANSGNLTPRYILSFGDLISRIENFSERCPNLRLRINQNYMSLEEFRGEVISTILDSSKEAKLFYRFSFAIELNEAEQYCPLYEGFLRAQKITEKNRYNAGDPTEYWG